MSKQNRRNSFALKHGAYSGMTLLPGEDPVAFNRLHNDLIDEFAPVGPFEEDLVKSLARLIWRKQNLATYRIASDAKDRLSAIESEFVPALDFLTSYSTRDPEKIKAEREAIHAAYEEAKEQARRELGVAWELVELESIATTEHLLDELSVVDRLDGMIDRCLKRLLFVRGLKSISSSSSTSPKSSRKPLAAA